ncbi:zf-HC2 domain-containing protein [Pseudonocardia sp. TRM90224]|uniref:zf-HC2 domain-containing protein n=1 Tax=Pseudonocardia sp. TRM90224 TaxID=2812678 RepID=UPI001E46D260|nr:zf-HC2 domain-containing protein [Pseudonocardia sp. TRM90224]
MRCSECREALSARLDGEDAPGESADVDAHLEECAECAAFAERAAHVTRLTRTRLAEPGPDLTGAVLAAAGSGKRRRRGVGADAVRLALGAVAVGQFALAISGVVAAGGHHDTGGAVAGAGVVHFAHESSAWNLALAVAFLWVATGPVRVAGLLPVLTAFVGALAALSVADVLGGHVEAARLVTHGLVVAGLVLLVVLRRLSGDGGDGGLAGSVPERPAGRARRRLLRPSGGGGAGGAQPTAQQKAA